MNIHEEYAANVRKKFPCPTSYEEIEPGYYGTAYDRINGEKVALSRPSANEDIGQINVRKASGFEFETSTCWYVKKDTIAERSIRYEIYARDVVYESKGNPNFI